MGARKPQSLARIRCVQGDITLEEVDAIVNAANNSLRGGGGVDGAIHRVAGPQLLVECIERHPDGCPTGDARSTGAYDLPAKRVIHTVGPVWRGGGEGEDVLLASCYRRSLSLAAAEGLSTIAFPAISCGVYGYPLKAAAAVAVEALARGLQELPQIEEVRLVLFDERTRTAFEEALARSRGSSPE